MSTCVIDQKRQLSKLLINQGYVSFHERKTTMHTSPFFSPFLDRALRKKRGNESNWSGREGGMAARAVSGNAIPFSLLAAGSHLTEHAATDSIHVQDGTVNNERLDFPVLRSVALRPTIFHIGKRSIHIAEQFAFQQSDTNGRTVYKDEWAASPQAFLMNHLGERLLAGSAFPIINTGESDSAARLAIQTISWSRALCLLLFCMCLCRSLRRQKRKNLLHGKTHLGKHGRCSHPVGDIVHVF